MKAILSFILVCFTLTCIGQNLTPEQLLSNAISYHDPNGNWTSFNDEFTVVMTTPDASKRTSVISIDLPKEYFSVEATRDTVTTTYTLSKGKCDMRYNGKILDSTTTKAKNMTCDRALLYKNYYSYLYGLPIKLKDLGTNLSDTVEKRNFKDKDYLVTKSNLRRSRWE